ncbi:hypothetical protein ABID58_006981 [Bradyrhizobium sp. S3.2.6]
MTQTWMTGMSRVETSIDQTVRKPWVPTIDSFRPLLL